MRLTAALVCALSLCPLSAGAQPAGHPRDVLGQIRASHYNCEKRKECSKRRWRHGRLVNVTASGETFDKRAMTAAHRTLPFGTMVRVTNSRTQKSVVVRINDRGPFVAGRHLDLTTGAARAIGMSGVEKIQAERVN